MTSRNLKECWGVQSALIAKDVLNLLSHLMSNLIDCFSTFFFFVMFCQTIIIIRIMTATIIVSIVIPIASFTFL